jgi:DNA repair exonuclease SbcCD ATPase subunit
MERLDRLFSENFGLKRDLAYEKKRYMDLMNAFLELRHSVKAAGATTPVKSEAAATHREDALLKEKQELEQTLMNLTEEVEALSKRNEEFLRELKAKHDFYGPYKDCQDELRKLREAHGLLISMIQT